MPEPQGLVILSGSHKAESPISYVFTYQAKVKAVIFDRRGVIIFLFYWDQIHYAKPNIQMDCSVEAFHQI